MNPLLFSYFLISVCFISFRLFGRGRARDPKLFNYPALLTFSRRLFRCVHFAARSCRSHASPCRRILHASQYPRRNAFAVRAMKRDEII